MPSKKKAFEIAVIVFFVGATIYGAIDQGWLVLPTQQHQKQRPSEQEQIASYRNATTQGDIAGCDNIGDDDRTKNCKLAIISAKAISSGDVSSCEQIPELKAECLSKYSMSRAQSTGNDTLCEGIADSDACYYRLAVFDKKPNLCEKITDADIKTNCVAKAGK